MGGKSKMETKKLIGILLMISLIVGTGIVVAHGNENNNEDESDITGMMSMMNNMDNEMMESMMGNMDEESMEAMYGMMEEMMDNEEFRDEMLEHMKACPMMKRHASE